MTILALLALAQGHGEFPAESLKVGEATREYRLIVPKSVDLEKPAPIVFAFHGWLIDSKDLMPVYTKLGATAEKHGFVLVFPNAENRSWALSPEKMVRDVAFFDALLAKLSAAYKLDPDRVFVVGMSNGGYMAHFVARERPKVVAAAASHSGALGVQTLVGIRADRKFPVLIVHGDRDKVIPVEIARENRDKYQKEGHEVSYVEVEGLGHSWATKSDVNETIWKFFASHPRAPK
jgi:polyhydroxybutyrate depolymerase